MLLSSHAPQAPATPPTRPLLPLHFAHTCVECPSIGAVFPVKGRHQSVTLHLLGHTPLLL